MHPWFFVFSSEKTLPSAKQNAFGIRPLDQKSIVTKPPITGYFIRSMATLPQLSCILYTVVFCCTWSTSKNSCFFVFCVHFVNKMFSKMYAKCSAVLHMLPPVGEEKHSNTIMSNGQITVGD